jgi:ADP-ribose pyrophosphatase YjhB (NUDIX family)
VDNTKAGGNGKGLMLANFLSRIWRRSPKRLRQLSMRLIHTRFTVTAGAIVLDQQKRVLLLKHRFRGGSGWGIPGGFIEADEQPADAVRRELREEVGLEIEALEIIGSRTFRKISQIEILFRCRARRDAEIEDLQNAEIKWAGWFSLDELPDGLPSDQKILIRETLVDGAKQVD